MSRQVLNIAPLGAAVVGTPLPTLDPFLFCVFHSDQYPAAPDEIIGNGHDFDPRKPFRMYHGSTIPGFPRHPHRGFETITATLQGLIDHADSQGNVARYGHGDVQWMTAGRGISHSEMFPWNNHVRLFQIWLNLPAKMKLVPPDFKIFWASTIPQYQPPEDPNAIVTIWAGNGYFGIERNPNSPPQHSWAYDESNDVAIWHILLKPGGTLTLPPAVTITNNANTLVNRSLFYIQGESNVVTLDGTVILPNKVVVTLGAEEPLTMTLQDRATQNAEFLFLQGRPIQEPVAQHGPFVMNTPQEIQQAFIDYQNSPVFTGWPWPRDDVVLDSYHNETRFASVNGQTIVPTEQDKPR